MKGQKEIVIITRFLTWTLKKRTMTPYMYTYTCVSEITYFSLSFEGLKKMSRYMPRYIGRYIYSIPISSRRRYVFGMAEGTLKLDQTSYKVKTTQSGKSKCLPSFPLILMITREDVV